MTAPPSDPAFENLLDYLRLTRGFDFAAYKRSSLVRRVEKRMQTIRVEGFEAYRDYLEVHPDEFALLFDTILINVTAFFRDKPAWDYLAEEIIPSLLLPKQAGEPLRIWSAGCASGEEAYSLAILLTEVLGAEAFQRRVKIYASDVDEAALTQARAASYTAAQLEAVPAELRHRYFTQVGDHFAFRTDLRRVIIFGRHDLVQDAPISRLDLLVCRNTLMYFNAEAQNKILARFHFALHDTGFLFLGKAEMLITHADLFAPVDLRYRVFTRVPKASVRDRLLVMAQAGDPEAANDLGRHVRLREAAFHVSPVAQLVVDLNGGVVLINERMRRLFGLESKDVGRPLQDLEMSYRPVDLRSLLDKARAERRKVILTGVERRMHGVEVQYFDVEAAPLPYNGESVLGLSIAFNDVTRYQELQSNLQRSNQELETANEELQSAHEELETTNEELQSTNEELETTNEELQSTNEELETMNEELQSTNEELETINTELRQRSTDLDNANLFLQSILASLRFGVVVLDDQFRVVIWNQQAEDFWGLREGEVRGQSFLDLDIGLPVRELEAPARAVLNGIASYQEALVQARNRRGKTIRCHTICTPLHTNPQGTGTLGVVLWMSDPESLEKVPPIRAVEHRRQSTEATGKE